MSAVQLTLKSVESLYAVRQLEWESAKTAVEKFLIRACRDVLVGEDESRLTVTGRIKAPDRTFEKARRKLAPSTEIASIDVIASTVADIVGVKILCKTLRDSTLAIAEVVARCSAPGAVIRLHEPVTDYVADPKPSGYRARHVLLELDVQAESTRPVVVELQVKTMLQDAWSELTHEDLYKPSGPLPSRHHTDLASTMAGLLSEVDKLADLIAQNADKQLAPTLEQTQPSATSTSRDLVATVTHTGPRYALATDDEGRRGLIPAVVVRDLVAPRGRRIDVDDYVAVGARLTVQAVETGDGYFLHPIKATELRRAALPGPASRRARPAR